MLLLLLLPTLALASPLDGAWRQPCRAGYQREEQIAGSHAVLAETNFRDSACTQPSLRIESRGLLFPGGNVILPIGAHELDFVFVGVRLTPLDQAAAAYYESMQLCGLRGWKVNEPQEIGGLFCDFYGLDLPVRVPEAGLRKFGVVKLEGDSLYLGRLSPERDASSPDKRPLELDPEPYRRVR